MKNSVITFVLLTSIATGSGCVSNKKFDALQASYNDLQSKSNDLNKQLQTCQQNLSGSTARVQGLEEQITALRANTASLQAALNKCLTSTNQGNVNISKLVDEINAANSYIKHSGGNQEQK